MIQGLSPLRELELLAVLSTELKKYTTNVKIRILEDARENFEAVLKADSHSVGVP